MTNENTQRGDEDRFSGETPMPRGILDLILLLILALGVGLVFTTSFDI